MPPKNVLTKTPPRNPLGFAFRSHGSVRQETREMIESSRQLLKATKEMAKGYKPNIERSRLLEHLLSTKRQAANGAMRVDRQRKIVELLMADNKDTADADKLLNDFEIAQEENVADMEKVLDQLNKLPC